MQFVHSVHWTAGTSPVINLNLSRVLLTPIINPIVIDPVGQELIDLHSKECSRLSAFMHPATCRRGIFKVKDIDHVYMLDQ